MSKRNANIFPGCALVGRLVSDLLESHAYECAKSGSMALDDEIARASAMEASGVFIPTTIKSIAYVAGDYSRIRVVADTGKEFRITVSETKGDHLS